MNREIRFRGKRVDNGEWVHGCYLHTDYHDSRDYVETHQIVIDNGHTFDVDPETVGQYIGFDDLMGTEIYEDDKVVYQTYKKNGGRNGTNNGKTVRWLKGEHKVGWNICPSKNIKVVGDIHERRC